MQDDGCVFWYIFIRKSDGGRVYPNLYSSSVPSGQKTGGSGCGGLSVLEESHVVGESGQLLLVGNQWDGGRICGERRGRRSEVRRGIPYCAKCYRSSYTSVVPTLQSTCCSSDGLQTRLDTSYLPSHPPNFRWLCNIMSFIFNQT